MYCVPWAIDYAFDYPAACTNAILAARLKDLAVYWPGWPGFPWRVTRSIHEFLGQPPVNFHYLMIHRCLTGFASHLVLKSEFEDRDAVLAMMIRERFEVVGVLRVLLIDALRYEMRFTKLPYILDCSGPEDGHTHLTPEELAKRRLNFQESIGGAEREFVRILNLASLAGDMNEWVLGRPLRAWARGGDMPAAVTLNVQVDEREIGKVLRPQQSEVVAIAKAGKRVPEVLVERKKAVGCRLKAEGERDATAKDAEGRGENVIGDQSSVTSESVGVVGAALKLAGVLDSNPRVKAPNHITVLKMYCLDEMTIGKIARKCGCTKGTVFNRKVALEKRLGKPLDVYRQMSGIFDQVAAALGDGRARSVFRRGLAEE